MRQLILYIRLKGLSYFRFYKEFPLVIRLLVCIVCLAVCFLLIKLKMALSFVNGGISLGLFILIARWATTPHPAEKILLKGLHIPFLSVSVIKCLGISLPFFLLNLYVGILTAIAGTAIIYFLPDKQEGASKALPVFYPSAAYQWLSSFRLEGKWVFLFGLFLLIMALLNGNRNLAIFSLVWLINLSCFLVYFRQQEPIVWLRIFRDTSLLMKRKVIELLISSFIPILPCFFLILLFMPAETGIFIKIMIGCFYINLLLIYIRYACYPSIFMASIIFYGSLIVLTIAFITIQIQTICTALATLPLLHWLTCYHLKSTLYADAESDY